MKPHNNEWRSTQPSDDEEEELFDTKALMIEVAAGLIIFATTVALAYWFFSTWAGKVVATNFPIG